MLYHVVPWFSVDESGPVVGLSGGVQAHEVHVPESALRRHLLLLGQSGVGKSTMIKHIVSHRLDMKAAGRDHDALVVIDPHGDLVHDLIEMVPPALADRVRLLDFGSPDSFPGINLLDPALFPDRDRCVDAIAGTLKHLWDYWGGRLEVMLRNSLMVIYEFNGHPNTERSEMLTILDVPALLDDGLQTGRGQNQRTEMNVFQRWVFARVSDPHLKQWFESYLNWPRDTRAEALVPIHLRIGAYLKHQRASVIMGQRDSRIRLSDVLSEGLILLVSTARAAIGVGPSAMLGGSVIRLLSSELQAQSLLPISERNRCLLVCEDFQQFAGDGWSDLLSDGRRHGCGLLLSCQTLQMYDDRLVSRLLGGFGSIAGFQMAAQDAMAVSLELGLGEGGDRFLVNQHPLSCMLRVSSDSVCQPAFPVRLLPPRAPVAGADECRQAILGVSSSFMVDFEEARARIDEEARERAGGLQRFVESEGSLRVASPGV